MAKDMKFDFLLSTENVPRDSVYEAWRNVLFNIIHVRNADDALDFVQGDLMLEMKGDVMALLPAAIDGRLYDLEDVEEMIGDLFDRIALKHQEIFFEQQGVMLTLQQGTASPLMQDIYNGLSRDLMEARQCIAEAFLSLDDKDIEKHQCRPDAPQP